MGAYHLNTICFDKYTCCISAMLGGCVIRYGWSVVRALEPSAVCHIWMMFFAIPKTLMNMWTTSDKFSAEWDNNGIKLYPTKFEFFKRMIRYIGQMVSREGIQSDPVITGHSFKTFHDWRGSYSNFSRAHLRWAMPPNPRQARVKVKWRRETKDNSCPAHPLCGIPNIRVWYQGLWRCWLTLPS